MQCNEYSIYDNIAEMFGLFEKETKSINPQPLLQKMTDKKFTISYKVLNTMREEMYKQVRTEFRSNHVIDKEDPRQSFVNSLLLLNATRKEHYYNIDEINCNSNWPVCTFDFTFNQRFVTYFLFKVSTPVNQLYIDDYYYAEHKQEDEKHQSSDILIERNPHFCGGDGYIDKFLLSMRKDYDKELASYIYDSPEIKNHFYDENGTDAVNFKYKQRLLSAIKKAGSPEANLKEKVIDNFFHQV
jgi:hypothetical protein